jgi:hypothetical protein
VAAWLELPDGKVLSGSEAGQLLLWEGGLIRAALNRCACVHVDRVCWGLHDADERCGRAACA